MITRLLFALVLAVAASQGPAMAAEIGDPKRGETLYRRQCATCHQVGTGAKDRIGPDLNRVFGRTAGSNAGFRYSRPMLRKGEDGLVWTLETLDAFIRHPRTAVPGTRMAYAGMADKAARGDLLAYLRGFSDMPGDIPEAAPTAIATDHDLDPGILAIEGDVEFGEYLASECTACHRRDGGDQGIPAITGWAEQDFVVAMHAYKRKLRPNPVMQMMAGRLADDEIAALAAYFATLK